MNINTIRTHLLPKLKIGVTPKLKPTVLYAEKHSKAIFNKGILGSKTEINEIPNPITKKDKIIVANAL